MGIGFNLFPFIVFKWLCIAFDCCLLYRYKETFTNDVI